MKVFTTTNDNYIVDSGDEKFYFDKLGNPYKGDPEKLGEIASTLRSSSSIFKSLVAYVENTQSKRKGYAIVDNVYGINVLLKIDDLSLNMEIGDEIIPYSKEQIETFRKTTKELEFTKVPSIVDQYKLGKYRNAVIMLSDELIKTTTACNRTIELYKNEINKLRREKNELIELKSYKKFPKEKPDLPISAQYICMINNDINGTRRTSYCIGTYIPQKGIFVDNNGEQILQGLGGIFWKEI